MRRIISVLAAMAIVAAMVTVMAMPAMAKNYKVGKGEPLHNYNNRNDVVHCGPSLEGYLEGYRGAVTTNSNTNAANCFVPNSK